jgi:hypothetical protein
MAAIKYGKNIEITEYERLDGLVPMIEALLAEGNKAKINKYRRYLQYQMFSSSVCAYTAAGHYRFDEEGRIRPWSDADNSGYLTNALFLMSQYAVFEFFDKFLANPDKVIWSLGNDGDDGEQYQDNEPTPFI